MSSYFGDFFSVINWPMWAGLFVSYFFLNILYTKNAIYTYKLEAIKAANSGVLIYILGYIGVAQFIENNNNIIPILASSWLGEYITIVWEQRNNIKRGGKGK